MRELLTNALQALTFANEVLGKPYGHVSEEMADAHYHLIDTIEKINQELNNLPETESVDVSDIGC